MSEYGLTVIKSQKRISCFVLTNDMKPKNCQKMTEKISIVVVLVNGALLTRTSCTACDPTWTCALSGAGAARRVWRTHCERQFVENQDWISSVEVWAGANSLKVFFYVLGDVCNTEKEEVDPLTVLKTQTEILTVHKNPPTFPTLQTPNIPNTVDFPDTHTPDAPDLSLCFKPFKRCFLWPFYHKCPEFMQKVRQIF